MVIYSKITDTVLLGKKDSLILVAWVYFFTAILYFAALRFLVLVYTDRSAGKNELSTPLYSLLKTPFISTRKRAMVSTALMKIINQIVAAKCGIFQSHINLSQPC